MVYSNPIHFKKAEDILFVKDYIVELYRMNVCFELVFSVVIKVIEVCVSIVILHAKKWLPGVDNPSEVHITLSPTCLYVKQKLQLAEPPIVLNGNGCSMTTTASSQIRAADNTSSLSLSAAARPVAQTRGLRIVHRPSTSAPTYPSDGVRSIDELIQKGTMRTEIRFDENKFCCKDLLKHWNDDRCFLYEANGKQLCGDVLYHKIQETNQARQNKISISRQSLMRDKNILLIIERCLQSQLEQKRKFID